MDTTNKVGGTGVAAVATAPATAKVESKPIFKDERANKIFNTTGKLFDKLMGKLGGKNK